MQKKNRPSKVLSPSTNEFQGTDIESLQKSYINHLEYSLAKDKFSATGHDCYKSLAYTVRDRLIERWIDTQQAYYHQDAKRVYYLSMEFLIGRTLGNSLINLRLYNRIKESLEELGYDLNELMDEEHDAGLGNGGLGRLAACFMDSMATLQLPAYGYGIRYEYGIFRQKIKDGYQVEKPDNWLYNGNAWEFERPEYTYPINFYGRTHHCYNENKNLITEWVDTQQIMAMAFDIPIPGYGNNTVNNMRLWSAKATQEFNFEYFNDGNYERAVRDKAQSETISKVLYPNDNEYLGKELRLKQEYFFVSATLQDIIRRYKKTYTNFSSFPDKVAIQLNDTHPAIAIPELMRLLVDLEDLEWDEAWDITVKTFAYTNHTILPEALETWTVDMMGHVLPRHLEIIYEINQRFLNQIAKKYPGNIKKLKSMSIIEEGPERKVRMAYLSIIGSHSVNGVAELHTEIIKDRIFKDFFHLWPEKFNNKTNGITQRRWLRLCNQELAGLISGKIGDSWITDLTKMKEIIPLREDASFCKQWGLIKKHNKEKLALYIEKTHAIKINRESLFDCQIKRIHEYKRQLLNTLHIITRYNRIKANPEIDIVPRTIILAGKAAPGYYMAKLIIKLINAVADTINNDPDIGDKLKVVFLENYSVTLAERIIPAADLSEQISMAGTEASGTGNMKFALNGALTIGTLDGANIEILEEVGKDNIFIFGLNAQEVGDLKNSGYSSKDYYKSDPELMKVIDMINEGYFVPNQQYLFRPIVDALLGQGDQYLLLADYRAYIDCQNKVDELYCKQAAWIKKSILNVAHMGKFSTDRTIHEYAQQIWKTKPIEIKIPRED